MFTQRGKINEVQIAVPVNRFLPLRSYSDKGPLLEGPGRGAGVEASMVVLGMVVDGGGMVVSVKSSSDKNNMC